MTHNYFTESKGAIPKMDHDSLVLEMKFLDRIPVSERAALAKMRRQFQLDNYRNWNTKGVPPRQNKGTRKSKIQFSKEVRLFEAVTKGDIGEIRELMDMGADPNLRNYEGLTPLHQSCIEGHVDVVKLLLERGARVNAIDADGWTPLHAAATCGHREIVELLVRDGADILASNSDEDMPFEITEDEETLSFLESEMIYQGITQRMVDERRRVTHSLIKRDIMKALREGVQLNVPVTPDGATFLHIAVANFYNDLIKTLLKNGADEGVKDDEGWNPIHAAAYWGNEEGLKLLIKHSQSNPDLLLRSKTLAGDTPYDLCDDHDLKVYIRGLLKRDSVTQETSLAASSLSAHEKGFELSFLNLHRMIEERDKDSKERELQKLNSRSVKLRRGSAEDIKTIVPLYNPKANEMVSDRRTSFKDAKKNAPNIRSHFKESPEEESEIVLENLLGIRERNAEINSKSENSTHTETKGKGDRRTSRENAPNPFKYEGKGNYRKGSNEKSFTSKNENQTHVFRNPFIATKNEIINNKVHGRNEAKTEPNKNEAINENFFVSKDYSSEPNITRYKAPNNYLDSNELNQDNITLPNNTLISLKKQRLVERELKGSTKRFSHIDVSDEHTLPVNQNPHNNFTDIKYHFRETKIELGPSIVKKKKRCNIM